MTYILTIATAAAAAGEQASTTLGLGAALEMLLWLAVVIGVILLCAWGFRRLNGTVLTAANVIRVRSVISVGNRERIALLEVGDKQILVGLCPGQISTLHVFEENVLPPLSDAEKNSAASAGEFASKLQSFINRDQRQ
ncbi:MAG: flagellar biosynthetic protein FliO [Pseudomonadota bacterium]